VLPKRKIKAKTDDKSLLSKNYEKVFNSVSVYIRNACAIFAYTWHPALIMGTTSVGIALPVLKCHEGVLAFWLNDEGCNIASDAENYSVSLTVFKIKSNFLTLIYFERNISFFTFAGY